MLSKEFVGIHDLATLGNSQQSLEISKSIATTNGFTDPMKDSQIAIVLVGKIYDGKYE
jgi:hypothetical protein